MSAQEFDVVVYGATGFTGRLVAEHLLRTYGADGDVRWAMAGRDREKLKALAIELGLPLNFPLIEASTSDTGALDALAHRTRVVITTVGPYQLYGEPLLAACVRAGTDYVDLCGEPNWMAAMIAKYETQAKQSGARIVFSCGFDSIPFDCGVWFLQQEAIRRFGKPAQNVRGRVRKIKGGASGGTMASMLATLEAGKRDPNVAAQLTDPFALAPRKLAPQPSGDVAVHDADIPSWSAPFIMAAINTKNVHRTNAVRGYPYGEDFTYSEMMLTGDGAAGEKRARAAVSQSNMQRALLAFAPTRWLLKQFALPKPGQGPLKEERESGMYDVLYVGDADDGRSLRAVVSGDKDPGYGSTSKMISEAALCLLATPRETTPGGIWTPAAAMGDALIDRLVMRAGLRFSLEN
ncbi:MAG TPA: saccharopine dehydrogenase NADP-binding domain-containing protein [Vitreimonas sp.]|uniref:saccharopine dehydrogenase family protein n=1 Tax=Vitreimonas sp. TaxID=3069702 RepID=UPI002D5CA277|nr:saccharopine dehydrogenase NADP-binding domain-containing protein [Vitreimonas sp.]HYD88171.1 saccharopine dehydrogenase NADP-binding domain-containing protein [Vitreimonas sp.]